MPFTPLPNDFIDRIMPTLKDTEWRLLCVIARQTLGWRQGERERKERDWLTHSQLQERTGRASEALCRALDSLVRKGLVEAYDDRGTRLDTSAARRRSTGRLFYRLGTAAIAPKEGASPKSEMHISESGIRKAKTTKETHTKYSPYGGEQMNPLSPANQNKNLEKPESDVHRLLRAYRDGFRRHTPHGEPPVIDWGKDGKLIKQLLRVYPYDRLLRLLEQFLSSDDEWCRKQGYSLYAFKASIGRLLVSEGKREQKLRAALKNPMVIHTPGWNRIGEMLPRDDGAGEEA